MSEKLNRVSRQSPLMAAAVVFAGMSNCAGNGKMSPEFNAAFNVRKGCSELVMMADSNDIRLDENGSFFVQGKPESCEGDIVSQETCSFSVREDGSRQLGYQPACVDSPAPTYSITDGQSQYVLDVARAEMTGDLAPIYPVEGRTDCQQLWVSKGGEYYPVSGCHEFITPMLDDIASLAKHIVTQSQEQESLRTSP